MAAIKLQPQSNELSEPLKTRGMDMILHGILMSLGAAGLLLAIHMTSVFVRVERGEAVTCLDDSCPVVMKSPYARSLGFPNSYLAIPFYFLVTMFAALRLAGLAAWLLWPVSIASALALLMSINLAYSLVWRLKRP